MAQTTLPNQAQAEVNRILDDFLSKSMEFRYSILGRFKSDCEYFLGNGARSVKHLWAGDVVVHIEVMKGIHNHLKEKPEWLSMEQILEFEAKMTSNKSSN